MKHCLAIVLCLSVLSCGDDDDTGSGPDASSVDGADGIDATVVPTVGPCSVSVVDQLGEGWSDVGVVYGGPDGEVLHFQPTDVDGRSFFESCVSGTMVTVVINTSGSISDQYRLETYAGVLPGDELVVQRYRAAPSPEPSLITRARALFSSNVTALPAPLSSVAGTEPGYSYNYSAPCSNSSFNDPGDVRVWDVSSSCIASTGLLSVLATARYAGAAVGYSWAVDVPPDLDGDDEYTDLTTTPWVVGQPFQVDMVNLPPFAEGGFVGVETERSLRTYSYQELDVPTVVDASETFAVPPAAFADRYVSRADVWYSDAVSGATMFTKTLPAARTIDAANSLPRVAGVLFDRTDRVRPSLVWIADGPLDAKIGEVGFRHVDDVRQIEVYWTVLFPNEPGLGSVQVPELPDALADLRPGPDSTFDGDPYGRFMDFSWLDYHDYLLDVAVRYDDYKVPSAPDGGLVRRTY